MSSPTTSSLNAILCRRHSVIGQRGNGERPWHQTAAPTLPGPWTEMCFIFSREIGARYDTPSECHLHFVYTSADPSTQPEQDSLGCLYRPDSLAVPAVRSDIGLGALEALAPVLLRNSAPT